ncbi:MAG: hypothetical protein GY811_26095 [Myxococcales bacterium]|nr:hypothetical protein [Myxococcales bacterium]
MSQVYVRGSHVTVIILALGILGASGLANAEPCAIKSRAANVRSVKIQPDGESPFLITLAGVPIVATPKTEQVASLDVQSPLRFTADHPLNKLDVIVGKRLSLYDGRLVLATGLPASFATKEKLDPESEEATMTLPLLEFQPESPLHVPCSGLTVSNRGDRHRQTPELSIANKPVLHATASEAFPLYARRKAEKPWLIKFAGPMTVTRRSGSWVKLRARWSDGSTLQGWTNSEKLSVQNSVPPHGLGALGTIGMGHCGRGHHLRPIPYVLKANAPIHTRAKGAIWAHTAKVLRVEAFALSRSDGWLQIASIDGLPPAACSDHNKFWVHADHIQWTSDPI